MRQHKVLIVEDDGGIRGTLRAYLEDEGLVVREAGTGQRGLDLLQAEGPFDLVLLDIGLPDVDGLAVLERMQSDRADVPVIIATASRSSTQAIQAMQLGAFEYLTKPFELDEVGQLLRRLFDHRPLADAVEQMQDELNEREVRDRIIGTSEAMQSVFKTIGRVARSAATVLIIGETGTGKELVADTVHQNSPRRRGPLIKVNCAALPETLLESELFGHEKGAFTSAIAQRKGVFEQASGGSIFLDEIGELTLSTQKKLLRVLQEGEFQRVGGSLPLHVDVRVIAATNKDLEAEVQRGRFREDLFYRLNVIRIDLPPLRVRKDDIPLLVAHFLDKYRATPDGPPNKISEDALTALLAYDWPGNVRELENTVQRAVVLSQGRPITPEDLLWGRSVTQGVGHRLGLDYDAAVRQGASLREVLTEVERGMVQAALRREAGDRVAAARCLGLNLRQLSRMLRAHGLSADD
ncbi:MAG: sigma-54-dependent Fis family transcriptional regulator [Anaerolineae bacterium]|nr:sigma-54-dependent Fis family transcriptional regulator [Anaerolineae bacterium]